jgi:hypothetical protein
MRDKDTVLLEEAYGNVGKTWCAIVLDKVSREKLLHAFEKVIPKDWTIYCNHMTIDYYKPLERKEDLGKVVELVARNVYGSSEYIAVEVEGYDRQDPSQPAHVTIAEPPKEKQSVEHPPTSFNYPLDNSIHLRGIIRNIPHSKDYLI